MNGSSVDVHALDRMLLGSSEAFGARVLADTSQRSGKNRTDRRCVCLVVHLAFRDVGRGTDVGSFRRIGTDGCLVGRLVDRGHRSMGGDIRSVLGRQTGGRTVLEGNLAMEWSSAGGVSLLSRLVLLIGKDGNT